MPNYDTRLHPPAPMIDVTIENPFLFGHGMSQRALLDTAADVTAIPQSVVRSLGLQAADTIAASGLDDVSLQHSAYIVNLQIADRTIERILVIEWPGNEILLGRDVLNEFEIRLDGKTRRFEIRDP